MIIDITEVNFTHSRLHIVKNWLKNYPISIRDRVMNILSIDSESPDLDLEISTYFIKYLVNLILK